MELPNVLDGLKDKLGFAGKRDARDEYDDEYYDDQPYDEFGDDDYGEYGYDGGSGYHDPHHAPLVSLDDVRASTQVPEHLGRDPLPPRQSSSVRPVGTDYSVSSQSTTRGGMAPRKVERAADYMISSPSADSVTSSRRSEGVDSLFSSTTPTSSPAPQQSANAQQTSSYDPYEAYAGAGRTSHNPTRSLTVVKPVAYGDVERVAKVLKAGDVVVLCMRNTPDQLAKRILDFSFGVSSALDASVDCIADKVFVILRGNALSDKEKMDLRNQGVL